MITTISTRIISDSIELMGDTNYYKAKNFLLVSYEDSTIKFLKKFSKLHNYSKDVYAEPCFLINLLEPSILQRMIKDKNANHDLIDLFMDLEDECISLVFIYTM